MKLSVMEVFAASDAKATTALYEELTARGPLGVVAVNVLRASKKSARAKVYRGGDKKGKFAAQAYEQKAWAMQQLCLTLDIHARSYGIKWGWKRDEKLIDDSSRPTWVLYIDLPFVDAGGARSVKQVSFHGWKSRTGPDYDGVWDGQAGMSDTHAIMFGEYVRTGRAHKELLVA